MLQQFRGDPKHAKVNRFVYIAEVSKIGKETQDKEVILIRSEEPSEIPTLPQTFFFNKTKNQVEKRDVLVNEPTLENSHRSGQLQEPEFIHQQPKPSEVRRVQLYTMPT